MVGGGSGLVKDLAEVLAFYFSNSFRGRGQVESRVGPEISSFSKSIIDSGARVGGGVLAVVARAGEVTAFSGDWCSMAVSSGGMGERMDE